MVRIIIFLFFGLAFLGACRKDKLDHVIDHHTPWDSVALSPIRIVNSADYLNVIANGTDTLTTWGFAPNISYGDPYTAPYSNRWSIGSSKYFPQTGQLKRTWRIPQSLFDKKGQLDLTFMLINGFPNGNANPKYAIAPVWIGLNNNGQPTDYYIGYLWYNNSYYLSAKRDEAPASRKDYFKIRVINRADNIAFFGNASGNMQNLWGPVTLTYADGTPVSNTTTNVGASTVSDYVELPYGKYQFRVKSARGWLIPGADADNTVMDPPTASKDIGTFQPNYQVYAPVVSFQPGANYTIIIYPNKFAYQYISYYYDNIFQNAFRIIKDNERAGTNTAYCRAQCVNALPGQDNLDFRVGGAYGIRDVAYGKASEYVDLNAPGEMKVEAVDKNGKLLASANYPVEANQNYTAYAYPDQTGQPQIVVTPNDLSGNSEVTNQGQDMEASSRATNFLPFFKKFLNLCPDIPYATFTLGDGMLTGRPEATNLRPGIPYANYPWYSEKSPDKDFKIMAYRSAPGMVPGTWADNVAALRGTDFIANKQLYANFNGHYPVQEPGFYTIALIGKTGPGVPPDQQPKMIVIKHNK